MYTILELDKKLLPDLKEIAKDLGIKKVDLLRKQDLIYSILDQQSIKAMEIKKAERGERESSDSQPSELKAKRGRKPKVNSSEQVVITSEVNERPDVKQDDSIAPQPAPEIKVRKVIDFAKSVFLKLTRLQPRLLLSKKMTWLILMNRSMFHCFLNLKFHRLNKLSLFRKLKWMMNGE